MQMVIDYFIAVLCFYCKYISVGFRIMYVRYRSVSYRIYITAFFCGNVYSVVVFGFPQYGICSCRTQLGKYSVVNGINPAFGYFGNFGICTCHYRTGTVSSSAESRLSFLSNSILLITGSETVMDSESFLFEDKAVFTSIFMLSVMLSVN